MVEAFREGVPFGVRIYRVGGRGGVDTGHREARNERENVGKVSRVASEDRIGNQSEGCARSRGERVRGWRFRRQPTPLGAEQKMQPLQRRDRIRRATIMDHGPARAERSIFLQMLAVRDELHSLRNVLG